MTTIFSGYQTASSVAKLLGITPGAVRKKIERSPQLRDLVKKAPNGRDLLIPHEALPLLGAEIVGHGSEEAMIVAAVADKVFGRATEAAKAALPQDVQAALAREEQAIRSARDAHLRAETAERGRLEEAKERQRAEKETAIATQRLAVLSAELGELRHWQKALLRARWPWQRRLLLRQMKSVGRPVA